MGITQARSLWTKLICGIILDFPAPLPKRGLKFWQPLGQEFFLIKGLG
ncbi:MAG: hypothetical protein ACK4QL_10575 [Pseudanabaenaceae cyanobacterium]